MSVLKLAEAKQRFAGCRHKLPEGRNPKVLRIAEPPILVVTDRKHFAESTAVRSADQSFVFGLNIVRKSPNWAQARSVSHGSNTTKCFVTLAHSCLTLSS